MRFFFLSVYIMNINELYDVQINPREDAGGLSREYVLRIPSVS